MGTPSIGGRVPSSASTRRSGAEWNGCRRTRRPIRFWRGYMWWTPGKAVCRRRATSASWPTRLKSPAPQTNTCTRSGPVRRATSDPVTANRSARLTDRCGLLDDVDHQSDPDRQGPLVEVERRLMQVQLRTAPRPHPAPGQRIRADRLDGVGEDARRDLFVDHRWDAAVVLQGVFDV